MKVTTFQTVAARLANTIGRDRGVRVTFGGRVASAKPGHVHLPALPAGTVLSPFEADLMHGYLDHEVGHIRRSDYTVLAETREECKTKPGLKTIDNWVEDVWSENETRVEYPGSERYLNTTHNFMDEQRMAKLLKQYKAGKIPTLAAFAMSLTYREIWKKRGLKRDVGTDLTLEDLGLGEVAELIEKEFGQVRSSQDSMKLARKIHALLEKAVKKFKPPPPGEENDEEDTDGEPGDGEPGDGEPGDGESGDGEPGDGGTLDRNAKPTEAGSLDDSATESEHQDLLEKILQRITSKNSRDEKLGKKAPKVTLVEEEPDPDHVGEFVVVDWKGDDYLPPAGTEYDRIFVPSGEDIATYRKERAAMAGQISSIKKALTIFLRSKEMKAWTRGMEDGRLDEDALADLCVTGNPRVFKQRRSRTFPNTAFAVLCDLSSSMKAELVRITATAFVEALAQLPRIKTMVAGFYTNRGRYQPVPGSGRLEGMDLLLFKGFDEPYRTAMPRLGAIGTSGCTPLGEGYAYGFEALVKRLELRKILLVITDGMPCYDWNSMSNTGEEHNDFVLMQRVHEKCKTHGIETLGLGIRYDGIASYVDTAECINGPAELAAKVLEMTKRVVVPC